MLSELNIKNFAIIEELSIDLSSGLVVFTGETGAGKSIILDAFSAVLGERVDQTSIRQGSDKALIEAIFRLDEKTQKLIQPILEQEGLADDPRTLILGREIRNGGRSIARVNGRSVNVSLQAEIGAALVDLHGQSEHLSLLHVRRHLDLLDRFAHQDDLIREYQTLYSAWTRLRSELKRLELSEQNAKDRADMLKYQIQEITAAKLRLDEEEMLRQERTRLSNSETLHSLTQQALCILDEGGTDALPVTDLLGSAVQNLGELNRIDSEMGGLLDRTDQALSNIAEIAYELRKYIESIEFNPIRLDQIEERLDLIGFLKRKYGGSVESVLSHLELSKGELDKVGNIEGQKAEVNEKLAEIKENLQGLAAKITKSRKEAAELLTAGIDAQLQNLDMRSARFRVRFEHVPDPEGLFVNDGYYAFDSTGIDKVEFLIETNPGEGFKPLAKIASGGETSRLMLALKHVLAEADQIPILVFDEIDQGIGGRVGMTVGKLLWQLGRTHQVMCVTHLPQLAAFGDHHLHVSKLEKDGRTVTKVTALSGENRQVELANMIGPTGAGALQSAKEILVSVEEITGKIK